MTLAEYTEAMKQSALELMKKSKAEPNIDRKIEILLEAQRLLIACWALSEATENDLLAITKTYGETK